MWWFRPPGSLRAASGSLSGAGLHFLFRLWPGQPCHLVELKCKQPQFLGLFQSSWVSSCFQSFMGSWNANILPNNFNFAKSISGGRVPASSFHWSIHVINMDGRLHGPRTVHTETLQTSPSWTKLRARADMDMSRENQVEPFTFLEKSFDRD